MSIISKQNMDIICILKHIHLNHIINTNTINNSNTTTNANINMKHTYQTIQHTTN